MIYIRVDANEQIATGHLMRTIAIAEAVREQGGDCCFITADYGCDEKLKEHHFERICLESVWNDLNEEISKMKSLIWEKNIKCLLIDSYFVTPEYFEALSKLTNIVYIDDLKELECECQALINYVIGEKEENFAYFKNQLYVGTEYAPLRKEFLSVSSGEIAEEVKNILVTTGGTDTYHFGMNFMKRILADERFDDCRISLVVGSKNMDKDYLLSTYGQEQRMTIYVDAGNMSQLMQRADCIVSAGGTTLYETCACKTPTISYAVADNQLLNVQRFDALGGLYYAGDIRRDIDKVIDRILDRLQEMKSKELREKIAESMGRVVDGKGSYRIAGILMELERKE